MQLSAIREMRIDDCPGLLTRARNSLVNGGDFRTIGQVMDTVDYDLLRLPNFGQHCLKNVRSVILDLTKTAAATAGDPDDDLAAFLIESAGNREFLQWCLRHQKLLEALKRELPLA